MLYHIDTTKRNLVKLALDLNCVHARKTVDPNMELYVTLISSFEWSVFKSMISDTSLSAPSVTKNNLPEPTDGEYKYWIYFISECLVVAAIIVIATFLLAPVNLTSMLSPADKTDQIPHLRFAEQLSTMSMTTPHFLYHIGTIATKLLSRTDWLFSGFTVNLSAQIVTVILLYLARNYALGRTTCGKVYQWQHRWQMRFVTIIVAFSLALFTPLIQIGNVFGVKTDSWLFGWIPPVTYHNPTQNVLRPLSLALFLFITSYLISSETRASKKRLPHIALIAVAGVLVILCGLAKPNYLLALVPATSIWLNERWS